jgi:pimeloyl-ACP methyl ester carboxylesterase
MHKWVNAWSRIRDHRQGKRSKPQVEPLEDRNLLNGGQILLQDDFNDNSFNNAIWRVDLSGPRGPASVTEQNQRMEIVNRGHLFTAEQFDPLAVGGLCITGTWTFNDATHPDHDFMQILTRSDGRPSGGFGETFNGIEFHVNGNDFIAIEEKVNGSANPLSDRVPLQVDDGDTFDFEITDDGSNLRLTMREVGGQGATATVGATSSRRFALNHITFHNREANNGNGRELAYLDNVVITATLPCSDSIEFEVGPYQVSLNLFSGPDDCIRPNLPTWIVAHGWKSSPAAMQGLAEALDQRTDLQIVTLDWSIPAGLDAADNWIKPVASQTALELIAYGFSPGLLSGLGHSWGSIVIAETAQAIPGGINAIVAIDPGRNGPGVLYNPDGLEADGSREVDFARDSQFSWAFRVKGGFAGSRVTPGTADESFLVSGVDHGSIKDSVARLFLDSDGTVGRYFRVSRLLAHEVGPWWIKNSYGVDGQVGVGVRKEFEAILFTTTKQGGDDPSIRGMACFDPRTGVQIGVPLGSPEGVSATSRLRDRVQITWKRVIGATEYEVYRATNRAGTDAIRIGLTTDRRFDDTTGELGRDYFYFVKASNSLTESILSDEARGRRRGGWFF